MVGDGVLDVPHLLAQIYMFLIPKYKIMRKAHIFSH